MAYVNQNLHMVRSNLNPAAKAFEYKSSSNKKVANVQPNLRDLSLNPLAKVFVYKFAEEGASAACPANYNNRGQRGKDGDKESLLVYYQPAPHIYPIINGHIVKLIDSQTGAPLVGTGDNASTPLLVYPQDSDFQYDENAQMLQQYAFETIPYMPPPYIPTHPYVVPGPQQQQKQQPQPQPQKKKPQKPPPPKCPACRRAPNYRKKNKNAYNQLEKEMTLAFQNNSRGPSVYQALLKLIADIKRPISYTEILDALAERLQRTDIEMKRVVPAALHQAILMGYLRKVDNQNEKPE
ncbi:uncharacterized protein [Drosophila tropicalis]|uniref:uncharacterized protein n=1 Tax=Drosophila tropicalis TaxID=46794 RepID=UPI0035ABD012